MKKLLLTALAGSMCVVFSGAYAQGAVSGPKPVPNSEKGVKTPTGVPDTRPDAVGKGEKPMAAPAREPMAAPAPAPAAEPMPARRAARREKG